MTKGKYLDRVYIDQKVDFSKRDIKLVEFSTPIFEKYSGTLKECFTKQLENGGFTLTESGANAFVLEVGYTKIDEGSAFDRWFWGFGAGSTDVQIEGRIKDEGNVLFQFADRRRNTGTGIFEVFCKDKTHVGYDTNNIAKDVVETMRHKK